MDLQVSTIITSQKKNNFHRIMHSGAGNRLKHKIHKLFFGIFRRDLKEIWIIKGFRAWGDRRAVKMLFRKKIF